MDDVLKRKVERSISLLKKGEALALALNPADGYYLAFSGGKDSQCVYELARMAGVKFRAYYSVTGIDAPDNVKFIMQEYPSVNFVHPKENYFRLVEKKGLPMIHIRFCCERLKEKLGAGNVLLDGIRSEESKKRAEYVDVMVRSRRKENIERGRDRTLNEIEENQHRCIKGKDRVDIHPILGWTEVDVWDFLKEMDIPFNPLYDEVGRVGCMFCPFASREQVEVYERMYPTYKKRLMLALDRFLSKKHLEGIETADEYLDWWKSKMTLKKYLERKLRKN